MNKPLNDKGGTALAIAILGMVVFLLLAWSHTRWDQAARASLVALDSLDQSRRAVLRSELLMERSLAAGELPDHQQLLGELANALVFVRSMRRGEGALAGMHVTRKPSASLDAALARYEGALEGTVLLVSARLQAPQRVHYIDLRPQQARLERAEIEAEALLLGEFSRLRAQQRLLDGLAVMVVGVLCLLSLMLLRRSRRHNEVMLASLIHGEAQLRAFAGAVPGVSFLIDRDGRYHAVYGSDTALLAMSTERLVGQKMRDVLPAELADQCQRLIESSLDAGEPRSMVYPLVLPDGRAHHFEGRISPLGDGSRVVWVSWDVTTRWQAEQRIHELKRLYEFLSNVNQAIVWSRERDELFATICRTAVSVGGFGLVWVSMRNADATALECVASAGQASLPLEAMAEALRLDGGGPGSQVFFCGDVLLLPVISATQTPGWCALALATGLKAYVGIPLRDQNVVVGVLNLLGPCVDTDDAEEIALMREVGIDLSYALSLFSREAQQREVEGRMRLFAAALESCQDGVMVTDLSGTIISINRAFTRITGYAEADALGRKPSLLQSGRHGKAFYAEMWAQLKRTGCWQGEMWNQRKDGRDYAQWMSISTVQSPASEDKHYVAVFTDITHLKDTEEQLKHLAHYDPLTDLPNRAFLNTHLEHALALAGRQDNYLAVLFIDVDNFKHVNDALGHAAGDELLVAVAKRLATRVRRHDTLGRLGGDEFLLVLESLHTPQDAALVAQGLLSALDEPVVLESGHMLYVRVSVGISVYPDDGQQATDLIRQADTAMYQAKRAGRGTYRFYTEALTAAANYRLELEARLRQAFDNDEFTLHYQPLISLQDNQLIGAEVLVRLQPPGMEPISPGTFIPLLEETGLIVQLGDWVMRNACTQGRVWLDAGLQIGSLAVNVSPLEICRGEFVQRLRQVLGETGYPPSLLEIELTESGLMEQGSRSLAFVEEIRSLGVRLSIDDFGTGYSSLSYLRHLPVDKLKIDRSFISEIPANLSDAKLTASIIAMARSLGITVLAEGVETEAQLHFLREQGCDACQGYLFSKPLPAEEYAARYLKTK